MMRQTMPLVIYIFALCAFALGFTEFVTIGLVAVISADLSVSIAHIGTAVTAYALGAAIGAPGITALATRWPRKRLLLMAMGLFTLGNLCVSLATQLTPLLLARFISGLGHGVFLAVASSVATELAGKDRSGAAVAVVFGGLTLALALGVPLGTYLGTFLRWQLIFMGVTISGAIGLLGLWWLMPQDNPHIAIEAHARDGLKALFNPYLLGGAGITVLAYAGAFTLYTYITPILLQVTLVSAQTSSLLLLVYGIMAAVGNIWGGRLTDRKGTDYAVTLILIGLGGTLWAIGLLATSLASMVCLIGMLGTLTYAAVPALQTRVIGLSHRYAPHTSAVAAGLNIAGFNSGIALGSLVGGATLTRFNLISTAWVGALIVMLGLLWLLLQKRSGVYSHQADV